MVAIDRSGDPLYYIITADTLPDLPTSTISKIRTYVQQAVELYYKQNTYHGCTRQDSPNFSFQANVDDGTCKPVKTNYTFGGVYQSCSSYGYTDLCATMRQKNPLTGDYSCPSGYEAVEIQSGTKSSSTTRHECHSCYLFFHCCDDNTYSARAQYTAYWCAATGPVPQNSGFLFGGLYTTSVGNRVTGTSSCPAEFYALHILENLMVCVSDDYELGTPNALPFAGFFSCLSGNPLAMEKNAGLLKSGKPSKLVAFMKESGTSKYPKSCPEGYSQHLAVNDRDCEVNYCVMSGSLTPQGLPKIHLPPYMKLPQDEPESNTNIVFSDDGTMWATMDEANEAVPAYLKSHNLPSEMSKNNNADATVTGSGESGGNEGGDGNSHGGLSAGGVAVISIVCTLVFVAGVVIMVKVFKRRRGGGLYRQDI